ncbi:peptide deformylase [Synechococcus sp. HJ21-Hayes]|uniref:peptide deformylase n=1 Tax=unclassified Synechococcus TaxID=2626047 RepID=UPI0020CCCFCB|nr:MULTISPECIES: peptide deformylase [unclassified Synechococcus]MCP9831719.1 peptide deformylase [Synechococcus sp. JJ3a-Johnson]MCP9853386.1 peptide deformylase [Synechococcus sp. HJ21-Hayes]
MASSFARLARSAELSGRLQVSKEPVDNPPYDIHQLGDEVLRTPARRIGKVDDAVRDLARDMLVSMYAARGIGLAAPQIGVHQQLLVIDLELEDPSSPPLVLINPEITGVGGTICTYEEGCLSIPGVYLDVVRPSVVEVGYRDAMGRPKKLKADGLMARCIQHEMDHLNGVLFVDRVTDEAKLQEGLNEKGFNRDDVRPVA